MIRALVLLLALANALLLAANLGWLDRLRTDQGEREPERLARQVNAEQLGLAPAAASGAGVWPDAPAAPATGATGASGAGMVGDEAAAQASSPASAAAPAEANPASQPASGATSPASAPLAASAALTAALTAAVSASRSGTLCVQASPVNPGQLDQALAALRRAGLPEGSWRTQPLAPTTRHMILMGRYDSRDTLQRKESELRRRQVDWVNLQMAPDMPAGFVPGLGLGRYDDEASARAALARLEARRVYTARIVELPPVAGQVLLRVPGLSAAQQARVTQLSPPANTRWLPCPSAPAGAGNGTNGTNGSHDAAAAASTRS